MVSLTKARTMNSDVQRAAEVVSCPITTTTTTRINVHRWNKIEKITRELRGRGPKEHGRIFFPSVLFSLSFSFSLESLSFIIV